MVGAESAPAGGGRLFATASGRFEFEPLTRAIPSAEGPPQDGEFPLALYVYSPLPFSFGEGAHLPYLQAIAGVQTGEMWGTWAEFHPDTAAGCGVEDGQMVRVRSISGSISVKARVLACAMPGVVSIPLGLGHTSYGRWAKGVGANPMDIADGFEGARVRVEGV